MEFLQGKPLDRCLAEGEIGLRDAVDVVRQVATALVAAHGGDHTGRPLVHLDLKPEHVFLERVQDRWHAKVIDFGIAEIVAATSDAGSTPEDTHPRRIAGTLPYMAPERWKGVVDPRCDIYSLGVILYEVAAGRKPFVAKDPERLRLDHETKVPVPPSRLGPERTRAARALDGIVLGCLEKDPGARPRSAAALAESLERWIERPPLGFREWLGRVVAIPVAVGAMLAMRTPPSWCSISTGLLDERRRPWWRQIL
jgi:serine/threonine-protein kinase